MPFQTLVWLLFSLKIKAKFSQWPSGLQISAPHLSPYPSHLVCCYSSPHSFLFLKHTRHSLPLTLHSCSLHLGCFPRDSNINMAFSLISFKLLLNCHLLSEVFPDHLFKIANMLSLHLTLPMPILLPKFIPYNSYLLTYQVIAYIIYPLPLPH